MIDTDFDAVIRDETQALRRCREQACPQKEKPLAPAGSLMLRAPAAYWD